jgi:gas vesicle protein
MSSDSKLLLGLILGAATGAVAGLLLAPASGKETRENISEKASVLKGDLDKKFNELSKKIQDLDGESINEFKEKFGEIKSSVKDRFDTLTAKVKDLEKELSEKMASLKKEAKPVESSANSI